MQNKKNKKNLKHHEIKYKKNDIKNMSENEWKKILTSEEFKILRQKGTEKAYSGKYYFFNKKGIFLCKACKSELFNSDHKFDSGTGWPSFYKAISKNAITTKKDTTYSIRIEVLCNYCNSHLGHVFNDGPIKSGLRYCINSIALTFKKLSN